MQPGTRHVMPEIIIVLQSNESQDLYFKTITIIKALHHKNRNRQVVQLVELNQPHYLACGAEYRSLPHSTWTIPDFATSKSQATIIKRTGLYPKQLSYFTKIPSIPGKLPQVY